MATDALGSASLAERLPLGANEADAWLSGGLKADGLHEAYTDAEEGVTGTAFLLLLAWMKCRRDKRPMVWLREARAGRLPYGPGLVELGLDPGAVTLLLLPDARAVLRAGLDAVRDGSAAAVMIELDGKQKLLDLTATRRLALAAAESATMVLLSRSRVEPVPGAAHTRWRVAPAPSRPLEAGAPGMSAFSLSLLRQRGGRDALNLTLEWDRDAASFRERDGAHAAAPLPCPVPAVAGGGAGDSERHRAA